MDQQFQYPMLLQPTYDELARQNLVQKESTVACGIYCAGVARGTERVRNSQPKLVAQRF